MALLNPVDRYHPRLFTFPTVICFPIYEPIPLFTHPIEGRSIFPKISDGSPSDPSDGRRPPMKRFAPASKVLGGSKPSRSRTGPRFHPAVAIGRPFWVKRPAQLIDQHQLSWVSTSR